MLWYIPHQFAGTHSRHTAHKGKKFHLEEAAENFCIHVACLGATNMCQADRYHLDTWIEYDRCGSWYHCLCTGVALTTAEKWHLFAALWTAWSGTGIWFPGVNNNQAIISFRPHFKSSHSQEHVVFVCAHASTNNWLCYTDDIINGNLTISKLKHDQVPNCWNIRCLFCEEWSQCRTHGVEGADSGWFHTDCVGI